MTTTMQYRMKYLMHPWNDKMRADGVMVWCLVRDIVTDRDIIDRKVVALFNLDSDAETFMRYLMDESPVPSTILVDGDFAAHELERRRTP